MKLKRSDHNRFIQRLDRTAEKNPLLWLPCVLLIVLALMGEHIAEYAKIAYSHRNTEKVVMVRPQLEKKPFALRAVAMTLVMAFSFMLMSDLGQDVCADEYHDFENSGITINTDPYENSFGDDFNGEQGNNDIDLSFEEIENTSEFNFEAYSNSESNNGIFANGQCGENVYWNLQEGILTITGYGKIEPEYGSRNGHESNYHSPWYDYNSEIKSVIISDGITEIGESIFYMCGAETIIMPESVSIIGDHAFCNCQNLKKINIPETVTYLGNTAFNMCTSIKEINVPSGINEIFDSTFTDCREITNFTVPEGVRQIDSYAFQNCMCLEKITIPDSVTAIAYNAFDGCNSLTIKGAAGSYAETYANENGILFIALDESTEKSGKCGENAYWELSDDGTLTISGYGDMYNYTYYDKSPWYNKKIYKIKFETGITSIGEYAFYRCTSLIDIEIPNSIASIKAYAFRDCNSLQNIVIPSSVISIGERTFWNCKSLKNITISEGVTNIGFNSFLYCTSLTSIVIPNSVTYMGNRVFEGCENLKNVVLSHNVNSIGYCDFYGCESLTTVLIPDNIILIEEYAFGYCTNLTNIDITENIKSIGARAFSNCTNLTSIRIPNSINSIEGCTFENCTNLRSIAIPDNVHYISNTAFGGCSNLTIYCVPGSTAEQYAKDNGIPYKNINEFLVINPPNYENIISSENGTLIYEAMSVDGYRPVIQYSIASITIKFGNGAVYDGNNLLFTADDNMIEINEYKYTDSYVTVYFTIWGMGKTNIAIIADNGENLTIPISIYDSNLTLEVEAETNDADDLKVSGKSEINNEPFQVGFSITPQLKRDVPGVDVNDRELFAKIDELYEQMESKVRSLLKIEKLEITLPKGFTFEDGSVVDNAIPIIPFRLDERTMYFTDNKVLTKVAPIADTGIWKEEYIFNVYIKINGNEYSCNDKIYVKNADYISPPPEDNPTIDDEHRDFYLQNDEYSKKLYNSIRSMINEGNFVETYSDSTLKNCVTDSNTYHDMITMLGIWKTAATSEFTIASDLGSYRNSVNNYCLEFYNVSVKDPNKKSKSAKNATVRFQLVDDLANYSSLLQLVQQDLKDIKFDATFNHINYQIEWSDKSYGINGIYNGIYQVSAGADINSYYEGVKQYLSTKYDNEIKGLLKNCFYGIVGNSASPLNFMSEAVEFCKLYEQANKKIGSMKKLIRTNVSFGMVCGAFKEYKVSCPVDVYIYDYDTDILLGSIVNNKADENNRIKMYVDGETKCFELPTIKKYKVKLVGNDIGNMTYSVSEYDKGQVYIKTANYYNLDLQNGKEYTYITDARTDEYLSEQNGNVIYPNEIYVADKQHTHRYNTEWKANSISHWHECTVCGERSDTARHIEDNGMITVQPTATTSGTKTYYCSVCGYAMRTETIPPIDHTPPYPVNPTPSYPTVTYPTNTQTVKEPYIYGDSTKSGWNTVISEIDLAPDGSTVKVNMNSNTELPKEVVAHIQNRNINLELSMSSVVWIINGLDVTKPKTVNMRVSDRYEKIPDSVMDNLHSELTAKQLRLYHSGDFGFKATLTLSVGKKYNNYYAALYHYNTKTKQLEFVDESLVANNQVTFELTHASYYAVAFNSVPMYDDISSGAGVFEGSIPIETSAMPETNGVTIPAIKLPQIMKYSNKKRRYRILKKRRLDDLVFVM